MKDYYDKVIITNIPKYNSITNNWLWR